MTLDTVKALVRENDVLARELQTFRAACSLMMEESGLASLSFSMEEIEREMASSKLRATVEDGTLYLMHPGNVRQGSDVAGE